MGLLLAMAFISIAAHGEVVSGPGVAGASWVAPPGLLLGQLNGTTINGAIDDAQALTDGQVRAQYAASTH